MMHQRSGPGPAQTPKLTQSLPRPRARSPPPRCWEGRSSPKRRLWPTRRKPSRGRPAGATKRVRGAHSGARSLLSRSHGRKMCPRRGFWECVWVRVEPQGQLWCRIQASLRRLNPCVASALFFTPACSSHRFTATTATTRSRVKPQTSPEGPQRLCFCSSTEAVSLSFFYYNDPASEEKRGKQSQRSGSVEISCFTISNELMLSKIFHLSSSSEFMIKSLLYVKKNFTRNK